MSFSSNSFQTFYLTFLWGRTSGRVTKFDMQSANPNLSLSKMIFQSVVSIKRAMYLASRVGRQNFFIYYMKNSKQDGKTFKIVTKASCSLTSRSLIKGEAWINGMVGRIFHLLHEKQRVGQQMFWKLISGHILLFET